MMRPLVTFVLYAFNEEAFIRQAVEGALAQAYSPLEIFLSDDGSTDRTFQIMQELAAAYRGPHKIILNRNRSNTGIGSQLNAAYQKSGGVLLVLANGDDISLPHRVDRIVNAWQLGGSKATAIASNMDIMTLDGRASGHVFEMRGDYSDLAESTYRRFAGAGAASLAVSRRCFDVFGALAENLLLEDGPLNLRSTLLGEWIFIEEPLVLYRVHEGNISQAYLPTEFTTWRLRHRKAAQWQMREGQKAYLQMLWDLYSRESTLHDPTIIQRARVNATRRLLDNQLHESYYTNKWPISLKQWWEIAFHLLVAVSKITVKKLVPIIEIRNERWHHRSVLRSARTQSVRSKELP